MWISIHLYFYASTSIHTPKKLREIRHMTLRLCHFFALQVAQRKPFTAATSASAAHSLHWTPSCNLA